MQLRFDEEPTTEFKNDLESIDVELIDWPDPERARKMVYQWVHQTWADHSSQFAPEKVPEWQWSKALEDCLNFRALPTPLEALGFTFRISGIDLQFVTHLIRHRAGSFGARCTGDRWLSHESALVPGPIQNSPELYERWQKIVEESKQLYCDMINTRKISIMDARTILPKCLEQEYISRFNLKDLVGFFKQRFDRQVQPVHDNLIAYYMLIEIAKIFPEITSCVNPHAPAMHYVKTARTGKATNLYFPDKDSDIFEWNPNDFIYQCERDELNGTDPELGKRENFRFTHFMKKCDDELAEIASNYEAWKSKNWNVD